MLWVLRLLWSDEIRHDHFLRTSWTQNCRKSSICCVKKLSSCISQYQCCIGTMCNPGLRFALLLFVLLGHIKQNNAYILSNLTIMHAFSILHHMHCPAALQKYYKPKLQNGRHIKQHCILLTGQRPAVYYKFSPQLTRYYEPCVQIDIALWHERGLDWSDFQSFLTMPRDMTCTHFICYNYNVHLDIEISI
jgi:hypothetical protein